MLSNVAGATAGLPDVIVEQAMRELIVRDDRELRRLNQAVAAFGRDCLRMHRLLSALLEARNEIEHRRGAARAEGSVRYGSAQGDVELRTDERHRPLCLS